HLVGLGLDITRRKQSEAEQERLQRELQQAQKMEALGQLTGGIAHDFNNILGIILDNNELALNYCAPDGQTKLARHLNNIHKAGTRAASLVAKMLAYSRSEASDDKPLQLQALVKGDLKMLSSTLPSSIEITTKIEENLPPVLMDQTQLSQLLMNLCVNAQDAMEGKGGLTIRLEWVRELDVECAACHKHVEGDWVVLSVADTGSGIPLEVQECIFDPFFTTKEVGKGTGLGMAVIHGIMRNHGGHVLMKTEQGKGTAFRLLFPPVVEEAETQETDPSSIELLLGQGEHILVVDDEPDLSEFIGDLLESHGYQSTVLTSSKKALKLFKKKPNDFALVITDQTMPGITGKVLVKGLREIRPDIPVILNTGFSEDIDEGSAAEMGIRYLEKPVRAKSLIQAVGELLRPMEPGTE
ncbi:MAG: response regulator, partial [Gammaproteobacteria bacterium]|nr:response regulator [Gammaproteobacteria bacterium]